MLTNAPPAVRKVRVDIPCRAYDVLIGDGVMERAGQEISAFRPGGRVLIVSDEVVAPLHLPTLTSSIAAAGLEVSDMLVAEGEASKSPGPLMEVVETILDRGLERSDVVVALGGGVVGDLAGFAAAIARRGMPFVQVPTSLLAQVDSAVGGKTGINSAHGKNLIGAFHQPALVLADTRALKTLSTRHQRAGYAEIAKIALINDAAFFARLEALGANALTKGLVDAIETAVAAKAAVVVADEKEAGDRALLNLGHTFAHGVERIGGYDGRIVHGEAVGLGICVAHRFSVYLGLCDPADAARVSAHMAAVGLPTCFGDIAITVTAPALEDAMAQDKKVKDGVIRFVLTRGVGKAFVSEGLPPDVIRAFLVSEGLEAP
ncbi:MAG: 3-dehydroquinate synthase [Pseudomonadota bacterium]